MRLAAASVTGLLTGLVTGLLTVHGARAADCRLERGPERTVARVLDAETVQLDDGRRVRLAGIVAPRARDTAVVEGRWPAETAAIKALDGLVTAKSVRLMFHPSRQDRHGQMVAELRLALDAESASVQERLLADGHARVDAVDGQRTCMVQLLAAEASARDAAKGLWNEPAYRVRPAVPARDVAAFIGTFQIVTGTVARVENNRDAVRLLFGEDWRRDLSLAVRTTDRETAGLLGGDLKRLTGRRVEARGWLVQRAAGGPEIDLSMAGHVRLLEGEPTPRR